MRYETELYVRELPGGWIRYTYFITPLRRTETPERCKMHRQYRAKIKNRRRTR